MARKQSPEQLSKISKAAAEFVAAANKAQQEWNASKDRSMAAFQRIHASALVAEEVLRRLRAGK